MGGNVIGLVLCEHKYNIVTERQTQSKEERIGAGGNNWQGERVSLTERQTDTEEERTDCLQMISFHRNTLCEKKV